MAVKVRLACFELEEKVSEIDTLFMRARILWNRMNGLPIYYIAKGNRICGRGL